MLAVAFVDQELVAVDGDDFADTGAGPSQNILRQAILQRTRQPGQVGIRSGRVAGQAAGGDLIAGYRWFEGQGRRLAPAEAKKVGYYKASERLRTKSSCRPSNVPALTLNERLPPRSPAPSR